jgi:SagB-type dehydrogenase family enzyme
MSERTGPHRTLALESAAELYHEASKLRESDTELARTVWAVNSSPEIRQVIANPAVSHRGFPLLSLPRAGTLADRQLGETLLQRRSRRTFSREPAALTDLSNILYFGAGITRTSVDSHQIAWGLRCAPSGGALYPIDIYCVAFDVLGVQAGLHAYNPRDHALECLTPGDFRERLSRATYLPQVFQTAAACMIMVARFSRSKFKYGERSYRFILIEAGHIAQNMLLVAQACGCGAVPIGGFVDDQLNAMLGLDGCDQAVVYAVAIGREVMDRD